ncbi:hypothetical protein DASC09_056070 [Saccharomycopsis crataegensis]|uniref:Uncharacterized protein n=1 Tax=Saccharomycopsis crataegensis TaxID=43959 RepID=A0AAV5QTL7_9ASCO|nr:hypothetical protein DASC09_056070 [Saccharomycopsis crataegensis]
MMSTPPQSPQLNLLEGYLNTRNNITIGDIGSQRYIFVAVHSSATNESEVVPKAIQFVEYLKTDKIITPAISKLFTIKLPDEDRKHEILNFPTIFQDIAAPEKRVINETYTLYREIHRRMIGQMMTTLGFGYMKAVSEMGGVPEISKKLEEEYLKDSVPLKVLQVKEFWEEKMHADTME